MCFIYNAWKFRNLIVGNFLLPHHMPQISQKFSATYYRSRACFIEYVARQGAPPHAATCLKSQQPPSLRHSGLSFVNPNFLSFLASNLAACSAWYHKHSARHISKVSTQASALLSARLLSLLSAQPSAWRLTLSCTAAQPALSKSK